MSVETVTYAPASAALRDWLRGLNLAGVVGARVFVGGIPDGTAMPAVEVTRVGGITDAPFDRPLVQFDCWSASGTQAETVAAALMTLLESSAGVALSGVRLLGATCQSPVFLPDDAARLARYVVTAEVTFKAA